MRSGLVETRCNSQSSVYYSTNQAFESGDGAQGTALFVLLTLEQFSSPLLEQM